MLLGSADIADEVIQKLTMQDDGSDTEEESVDTVKNVFNL